MLIYHSRVDCVIAQHMTPDRAYEDHYPELQAILAKILARRSTDFADLFAHDKFMTFIDLFQKDSVKVTDFLFVLFTVWPSRGRFTIL